MYTFNTALHPTAEDRSGNNLDATRQGGTEVTSNAAYGNALAFDAGGRVETPRHPLLTMGPPLTIEAWVLPVDDNDMDTIVSDRDETLTPESTLHLALLAGGGIEFTSNDECTTAATATSTASVVAASDWTHVAVTWDGQTVAFYVDGIRADQQALSASPCRVPGTHLLVGGRADGVDPFEGSIDELKISDYVKSPTQIVGSMMFDSASEVSYCGDGIVEAPEECDMETPCCVAATCTYAPRGTPCGSGSCDTGVCEATLGRTSEGLLAFYDFAKDNGSTIEDVAGVGSDLDLEIADIARVSWSAGALTINEPTMASSTTAASKLIDACQLTNAVTVEAWVSPGNVAQSGPARIVTLSADVFNRNFGLGQSGERFSGRVRSSIADSNGSPRVNSRPGDLATSRTHVVFTVSASGERTIYVDGVPRARNLAGLDLSNWDPTYRLALGDEFGTEDRSWLGTYYLVAIYDRALSAEDVGRNFLAGAD